MLGKLFAPLAMKLAGGLIGALLASLALVIWRADAISGERDDMRDRYALSEARHAVTAASLTSLQSELAAMVAEGEATRGRVAAALAEARADGELLRGEADQIRAAIIADPCLTPTEILRGSL